MILPIKHRAKLDLRTLDADQPGLFKGDKEAGHRKLEKLAAEVADLQETFYAARTRKMLVVFQGMDTSGKSGSIRAVFKAANPQGVTVASFKRPTPEELAHDYLWRIHARAPANGEIVLFDRSHYEDVTAVRVHALQPRAVWSKRFDQICAFERMLAEEGTIILKFFLHIDRDEQKKRLESRLHEPSKRWKFEAADLLARKHWDDYMAAYSEAIARTSQPFAPWYVVPANRKWLRNLIVASVVAHRMRALKLTFPKITLDPAQFPIE